MFKRAFPATGGPPVYAVQDEEIDFERIVKEEEIPVPRAVNWSGMLRAIPTPVPGRKESSC